MVTKTMISWFFVTPSKITLRGQHNGLGFYHPNHTNQMIVFVSDFWRTAILYKQFVCYDESFSRMHSCIFLWGSIFGYQGAQSRSKGSGAEICHQKGKRGGTPTKPFLKWTLAVFPSAFKIEEIFLLFLMLKMLYSNMLLEI